MIGLYARGVKGVSLPSEFRECVHTHIHTREQDRVVVLHFKKSKSAFGELTLQRFLLNDFPERRFFSFFLFLFFFKYNFYFFVLFSNIHCFSLSV